MPAQLEKCPDVYCPQDRCPKRRPHTKENCQHDIYTPANVREFCPPCVPVEESEQVV